MFSSQHFNFKAIIMAAWYWMLINISNWLNNTLAPRRISAKDQKEGNVRWVPKKTSEKKKENKIPNFSDQEEVKIRTLKAQKGVAYWILESMLNAFWKRRDSISINYQYVIRQNWKHLLFSSQAAFHPVENGHWLLRNEIRNYTGKVRTELNSAGWNEQQYKQ